MGSAIAAVDTVYQCFFSNMDLAAQSGTAIASAVCGVAN